MNSDTEENRVKVVLDTNVLVSAIIFGGKPIQIIYSVIEEEIIAVTSPILISELKKVLTRKFPLRKIDFESVVKNIEEMFTTIQPKKTINVSRDEDDNRVLEAAWESKCNYIVMGDRDLLDLKVFKKIKIVTPDTFLSEMLSGLTS
ncbi:MAG: putative toxin-antitoxin system toxin component, PIN family [bacterium]|nr:putative toxin-antitoxin system toxin component, PIN family [bacterium]